MKQKQPKNWEGEPKFTPCKSIHQCIDKDPFLKRRNIILLKLLLGLSDMGNKDVRVSINKLCEMMHYGRTQTMLSIEELIVLGYVTKIHQGGKNIHDMNGYTIKIPNFYRDWLVPKENKSKFTDKQKIIMAINLLKKEGVVGEDEMRHAILQTRLKPHYEDVALKNGLAKIVAKGRISNAIKRFNEKNNSQFPNVIERS